MIESPRPPVVPASERMFRLGRLETRSCQGISRREMLQLGACSALGLGLPHWAGAPAFGKSSSAAAAELVPLALLQQLKPGGRMVLPTGLAEDQKLTVVEKDVAGRARIREIMSVRFSLLETVR